jgi:four helix bundle protein
MRRASVSVPSNIAEGYGRRTPRQRYHFLETALGSLFELETQIELSFRLGFLHETDANELAKTIRGCGRGLTALMRYVSESTRGTPRTPEELRGT